MKIKYEITVSVINGRIVKVFREAGTTKWRTFNSVATSLGRDPDDVRKSVRAGRPPHVPSRHYFVVGGEFDGQWLGFTQLGRLTGSSPSHCARLANHETATVHWRPPSMEMVKAAKRARNIRETYRPTALDGVSPVASMFNSLAFHQGA